MNYQGDISLGDTIDYKFTTVSNTGVPTTLAGSPAVAAYVDNNTTEVTAGVTLTVDFDARVGLHNVRVVASSGNGFATGTNINLILTAGTVGSTSVVGYVIGSFSIEKRSALRPTTAGRTLDVAATGEAGLDYNNIAGTIPDSAGVTTLLGRVSSTIFTGITSLKEWLGLLAGKQVGNATARTEVRSSGAGSGTFDETTDSQEALRDRGDAAWITGSGGDPWTTALPGAYGAGTAGNILGTRLDAAVTTRATPAQVQTELGTYGALKPTVATRTLDVTATGEAGIDLDNTVGTLAKGTDLTGFNDISAASVQTELTTYGALKPTVAGRTLDVTATGEAGLDYANTAGTPADSAGVSTLLTRVPSALTITSGKVDINDKTGFSLSTAGIDAVWAKTMTELSSVPGVTGTTLQALEWVFLLARNKITSTSTTQVLRNDADSATIGSSAVSDDGTTFTRGEFA
jgi:hypothetical protein